VLKIKEFIKSNTFKIVLVLLLLVGFVVRLVYVGVIPGGLNQDEAYAGYEAYSMFHYGVDSHGYHNPVYMSWWGDGGNAMYSYLSIPAVAIFGLNLFSIRITQAILGCITLVLVYLLVTKLFNKRLGMCVLFLFVISPWHIMISRWGLEANTLIFFLILGLLGFVYAIKNHHTKWLLLMSIGLGCACYCYAPAWLLVPFMVIGFWVYGLITKSIKADLWFWLSAVLLVLIAFQLLLFILVNSGYITEIRTSLFSVPKLPSWRGSNYGIGIGFLKTIAIILLQYDKLYYNAMPEFGVIYLFSLPIVIYAVVLMIKKIHANKPIIDQDKKTRQFIPEAVILILFAATLPNILFMLSTNVNRINYVWIPYILCAGYGVYQIITRYQKWSRPLIILYVVNFLIFVPFYFNTKIINFTYKDNTVRIVNEFKKLGKTITFDGYDIIVS
jgi:4-amino-4-deoxy-L-arabinose transferase-like glycosyltransferase